MNYEYYRIFYYVGKHKNITKAAAELYSSQPAVTRAIQNLESELGCLLFTRNKTGVEFTHEGKALFEYVSIANSQLMKGEDEVKRSISLDGGTIYIGSSVTSLHEFLFDFLDSFHIKHPAVKYKINTASNNTTVERLKSGMVDLAFVSTPYSAGKGLTAVKVKQFNDILIAGNSFADLKEKVLDYKDLLNYPFVCLRHTMQLRQFVDDIFAKNGLTITPDIEADGADLLVPMISHNFGLGIVPQDMAQDAISRGEVFQIPLKTALPPREIYMLTDPHHPQTNASRELMKNIIQYVKTHK